MRLWATTLSSFSFVSGNKNRLLGFFFLVSFLFAANAQAQQAADFWLSSKLRLEAEVKKDKEWDLRTLLKKGVTAQEISSDNLPTGYKIEKKKLNGADTFVLSGKTDSIQQHKAFQLLGKNSKKISFLTEVIIDIKAPENIVRTATQGGVAPKLPRPINLSQGRAGEAYSASIASLVTDPDPGDTFTFSFVSGASWLKVRTNGTIETDGVIPLDMAGSNVIRVRVKDSFGLTDETLVYLEVAPANQPPQWTWKGEPLDEVALKPAQRGQEHGFDVSQFASDPDGQLMLFSVVDNKNAPWFSIRADGMANGIPTETNSRLGEYYVILQVTDNSDPNGDSDTSVILARGTVVPPNNPPTIKSNPLKITVKERGTWQNSLVGEDFVTDKDGDKLTFDFTIPDTATSWIKYEQGLFKLTPAHEHANQTVEVPFSVSDGITSAEGVIQIYVARDPLPPQWVKAQPYTFEIPTGKEFSESLLGYAKDFENLDVTYELVGNPKWLVIDEGPTKPRIFGRPGISDVGELKVNLVARNTFSKSAAREVTVKVVAGNLAPKWTLDPNAVSITLNSAKAGAVYSSNLNDRVADPNPEDKGKLTFQAKHVAGTGTWAFVNPQGRVFGVPDVSDPGVAELDVTARDPQGATATARIRIPLKSGNVAPVWKLGTDGMVDGGSMQVGGAAKSIDLTQFVTDADDSLESLTFKRVVPGPGPAWGQISGKNQLVMNPPATEEAREYVFLLTVTDGLATTDEVGLKFKLTTGGGGENRPPVFLKPVVLSGVAGKGLRVDLKEGFIQDPDGDEIAVTWVSPSQVPAWLNLSNAGVLTTTQQSVVGNYNFGLRVTDSKGESTVDVLQLTITAGGGGGGENRPPAFLKPVILSGVVGKALRTDLKEGFIQDPDGDEIAVTWVSPSQVPAWLNLTAAGVLTTTQQSVVGNYNFGLRVTDAKGASTTDVLQLAITAGGGGTGRPPIWLKGNIGGETPLVLRPGEEVNIDLPTNEVANIPAATLYFGKRDCTSGWITVSRAGNLKIAPTAGVNGTFTCEIIASNDPAYGTQGRPFNIDTDSPGILRVTVQENISAVTRFVRKLGERPATGLSSAEILFVVDNRTVNGRSVNQDYMDVFKAASDRFLKNLTAWGVNYRIAVISSRDLQGRLLAPQGCNPVLLPSEPDPFLSFQRRLDAAKSNSDTHSPLLALSAAFENLSSYKNSQGQPTIDKKLLGASDVPLFVYFVNHEPDQFETYFTQVYTSYRQTPKVSTIVSQLYKKLAVDRSKPVLIYAEDHSRSGGSTETLYRALTDYTHGDRLVPSDPNVAPRENWLDNFAKQVAWQSYRFRQSQISLENMRDTKNLRVFLEFANGRSIELAGRTQDASKDQWTIADDSKNNKPMLWINWWNVRVPYDSDNDKIVLRY